MANYPKNWIKAKLGDIGTVQMCRRIFQHQTKSIGEIPFYKIGTFGDAPDAFISRDLFEDYKSRYPFPHEGDVLLSAAGTIGKAIVFGGADSYFQDSNIVWLNTNKDFVDSSYLWWFYRSYPWNALEGTTINRLYNSIILNTTIYLPPLEEQKAIANALNDLDAIIESVEKLIAKKQDIRNGTLEDLIKGSKRLLGFDDDWREVSFSQMIVPKARIGWQGLKSGEYLKQGYSYLISGTDFVDGYVDLQNTWNVSKDRYEMDNNIQVHSGDVLVTKDGTIGKVAMVKSLDKPATLNSGVFVFRTKEGLDSGFLFRLLQSSVFNTFIEVLSAGSTIQHLYQKDLKRFKFYMPKNIKEQQAIATTIQALDNEIASLKAERDKWVQIRDGAMDDLLSGRVRLNLGDEICQA